MKINVLDPKVYNRISAGEVVEKPASVVKELVENSLDAKAKHIRIEIEEGGIKNITVSDDGCGIEKEDLVTAFLPHATSKIKTVDDLDNIESLGFRGEALASISSVCQVKMSTKTETSQVGYSIKVNGGIFDDVCEVARTNGTTITCSNIFFNTPVRAKFLRKPKTEEAEVTHIVEKFMLSHSEIAFAYYVDGKMIYNTTSCSMQDIIYTIYGKEIYDNLIEVDYKENGYRISGYITKPKASKSNRTYQTLFVNGRYIENYLVSSSVQSVYESFLMKGRFPVYVLSIEVPPNSVDVNVHPSKNEVKFDNPNKIFGLVRNAIEKALLSTAQIANFDPTSYKAGYYDKNNQNEQTIQNQSEVQGYSVNGNISLEQNKGNDLKSHLHSQNENDKRTIADFYGLNSSLNNKANNNSKDSVKDNSIVNTGKINGKDKNLAHQGHSFSVDLFDPNEKIFKPQEYEIEIKKVSEIELEKGIIDSNEQGEDKDIDDLSKMSIKDKYIVNTNDPSTFYFDQKGEKFASQIKNQVQEQSFLKASVKDEMKILGTLFKTYIVIELNDSVYFIDQHAAHERLLYDTLVKQVDNNEVARQDLLSPYTFTLGAKESQQLDMALNGLKEIGFNIEKNNYTYMISSVPYVLTFIELDKFVDDLVRDSINWDKKPSDFIHDKLCQSACKHAIKAGDSLSKDECAYLIEEVRKGVMLCPHGRPITLVITKYEFEKMFKRIV